MDLDFNKLDDDWINNFEKTDRLYQDFYKDDLYYINLQIIYINRLDEIEKIKQESFLMSTPNYISREEIIKILKNNSNDNGRQYRLLSILRYNVTLDPNDVTAFLKNNTNDNFLTIVKNIDAISFEKTINMMQDLNDIIFIFYEKSNELKRPNLNVITKKQRERKSKPQKYTLKKQYKE